MRDAGSFRYRAARSPPTRSGSTACRSSEGVDYKVTDGGLVFSKPLEKERIGVGALDRDLPRPLRQLRQERLGRRALLAARRAPRLQPAWTSFRRRYPDPSWPRIDQILEETRPCFSFEFFPPKTEEGEKNLREALSELQKDKPSFVSVTYGAGGSTRDRTIEIVKWIKQDLGIEAMAHFTCVGRDRRGAARDARRHPRRRDRQRARAARRPAAGRDRVDEDRGRARVLDRS